MGPNNSGGNSSGQSETSLDGGLYFPPFLKTAESLPQQIDPEVLYVGLPSGWVAMMDAVADLDMLDECLLVGQEFLVIKNGKELQEMLR